MSSVDILVPDLPESVADATVATWHKKPGDSVKRDEVLVEIETDKVVLEVPASADGILDAVLEDEGTTVTSVRFWVACVKATARAKSPARSLTKKRLPQPSVSRPLWKSKLTTRSARRSVACWPSTTWMRLPLKAPVSVVV